MNVARLFTTKTQRHEDNRASLRAFFVSLRLRGESFAHVVVLLLLWAAYFWRFAAPNPALRWALQGGDKRYVCLLWYFQGRTHTPDQLAHVLEAKQSPAH